MHVNATQAVERALAVYGVRVLAAVVAGRTRVLREARRINRGTKFGMYVALMVSVTGGPDGRDAMLWALAIYRIFQRFCAEVARSAFARRANGTGLGTEFAGAAITV